MDKLQAQSETELKINDVVTYDGESWVIVDTEDEFLWIRHIMDHTTTEKVSRTDIIPEGGYGDTRSKEERTPRLSSVIFEDQRVVSMLPRADQQEVEEATGELVGKTWKEVGDLQLPSA